MSRLKYCALSLGLLAAPLASADVVGAAAGVEYWKQKPGGWVQESGNDRVDLEDDLNVDSSGAANIWAAFEHPLPMLPNLKLAYTPMGFSGDGDISRSFTLGDVTFSASENVRSDIDLDQDDLIFYYEILDNWLSLDLGVNVKLLDGEINVRSASGSDRFEFAGPVPMAYARLGLDVPASGWGTDVEVSGISFNGHKLLDAKASVKYGVPMGLNFHAGWRKQTLKLDELDEVSADIEVDGPFVGVSLDW